MSEESGCTSARRDDHRRARPGRRFDELLAHDIPYWATSICALDADGMLAGARREPGDRRARHRGPRRRRVPRRCTAARVVGARIEDAMVVLSGLPARLAAVEAVPVARLGRARAVRARGRAVSTATSTAALPRAVGLPRRATCVRRSRRRRADATVATLVTADLDARRQLHRGRHARARRRCSRGGLAMTRSTTRASARDRRSTRRAPAATIVRRVLRPRSRRCARRRRATG